MGASKRYFEEIRREEQPRYTKDDIIRYAIRSVQDLQRQYYSYKTLIDIDQYEDFADYYRKNILEYDRSRKAKQA